MMKTVASEVDRCSEMIGLIEGVNSWMITIDIQVRGLRIQMV